MYWVAGFGSSFGFVRVPVIIYAPIARQRDYAARLVTRVSLLLSTRVQLNKYIRPRFPFDITWFDFE